MEAESGFFRRHTLSSLLGSLLVLFGIGQWVLLDRLESSLEGIQEVGRQDEMRTLLPLLRLKDDHLALVEEFLRTGAVDWAGTGADHIDSLQEEILSTYGPETCGAHWDGTWRLRRSWGFPAGDLNGLGAILENFVRQPVGDWAKVRAAERAMVILFGGMHLARRKTNNLATAVIRYRGRRGTLLVWNVPETPERINPLMEQERVYEASSTFSPLPRLRGSLALFVPEEASARPAGIARALRSRILSKTLPIWAGPEGNLPIVPGITPDMVGEMWGSLLRAEQGALVAGNQGGAYFRLSAPASWVLLHLRDFPASRRLARSPGLVVFLLLIFLTVWGYLRIRRSSGEGGRGSLVRHFGQLAVLTCLVPTLGLAWTLWSRDGLDRNMAAETIFKTMDNQLEALEQVHFSRLYKTITVVKEFLGRDVWLGGTPPSPLIQRWVQELRKEYIQDVYLVSPDFPKPQYFNSHPLNREILAASSTSRSVSRKTVPLMQSLLDYTQKTLKLGLSGEATLSEQTRREIRGGMVFEYALLALGAENLLKTLVETDRLVPFRLPGETSWCYFHISRDQKQKARRMFFIVLDRDIMQRQNYLNWAVETGQASGTFPDVILMATEYTEVPLIFPEWDDLLPAAGSILKQTFKEKGVQKLVLERPDGGKILWLSRPLRDIDFVGAVIRRLPEDEPVHAQRSLAVLALLYPFLVAALVGLLFQGFFLRPVRNLQLGVNTIAAGNYNVRLPVLTDDEIGNLCGSFNRMAEGLREKEFLRRFVSDLTMEAVDGKHVGRATRLTGTILMADIRKFTTISEEHPPEAVVEMLNGYLTLMEEVIERHGGTIDKFIGDAIMAVFLPVHGRDHPARRAALASLEMMKALGRFNRDRHRRGQFTIAIGAGIASGELLMGMLGRADGRRDFTVTGPTVNRAAAMEKLTKKTHHTKVVVCPETAARLGEGWTMLAMGEPGPSPEAFELGMASS